MFWTRVSQPFGVMLGSRWSKKACVCSDGTEVSVVSEMAQFPQDGLSLRGVDLDLNQLLGSVPSTLNPKRMGSANQIKTI